MPGKIKSLLTNWEEGQTVKIPDDKMHWYLKLGVPNLYGTLTDIDEDSALVHLDAPAMLLLADHWLRYCLVEQTAPWYIPVKLADLEPAEPREFPISDDRAIELVERRMAYYLYMRDHMPPEDEDYDGDLDDEAYDDEDYDEDFDYDEATLEYEPQMKNWVKDFSQSPAVQQLPEEKRDLAFTVAHSFLSFAWMYDLAKPKDLLPITVRNLLTHVVPQKITAGPKVFTHYSELLILFFQFMEKQGLMEESGPLCEVVLELKEEIFRRSEDASQWGMSKGLMMQMIEQGVDPTDKKAVERFIDEHNRKPGEQ